MANEKKDEKKKLTIDDKLKGAKSSNDLDKDITAYEKEIHPNSMSKFGQDIIDPMFNDLYESLKAGATSHFGDDFDATLAPKDKKISKEEALHRLFSSYMLKFFEYHPSLKKGIDEALKKIGIKDVKKVNKDQAKHLFHLLAGHYDAMAGTGSAAKRRGHDGNHTLAERVESFIQDENAKVADLRTYIKEMTGDGDSSHKRGLVEYVQTKLFDKIIQQNHEHTYGLKIMDRLEALAKGRGEYMTEANRFALAQMAVTARGMRGYHVGMINEEITGQSITHQAGYIKKKAEKKNANKAFV